MFKETPEVQTNHAKCELLETAPKEIYLQIADDLQYLSEPFPDDHEGITWCEDSVYLAEVPYIRRDIYQTLEHDLTNEQCASRMLSSAYDRMEAKYQAQIKDLTERNQRLEIIAKGLMNPA